jgi:hypothetical protein
MHVGGAYVATDALGKQVLGIGSARIDAIVGLVRLSLASQLAARSERKRSPGSERAARSNPDVASLHPGYG